MLYYLMFFLQSISNKSQNCCSWNYRLTSVSWVGFLGDVVVPSWKWRGVEEKGRRRGHQATSCMGIPISRVLWPLHSAHQSIPYREHQVPQKLSDMFVCTSEMFRCSVLTALRGYDGIVPFLGRSHSYAFLEIVLSLLLKPIQ